MSAYEPSKATIEAALCGYWETTSVECEFEVGELEHAQERMRAALIAAREVEDTLRVERRDLHAKFQAMAPDAPLTGASAYQAERKAEIRAKQQK